MRRSKSYTSYTVDGPKKWLKSIAVLAVLGGFGSLVWFATVNKESLIAENGEVEYVAADNSPVKERAADPGGMHIPNQDKRVFDLLAQTAVPAETETVAVNEDAAKVACKFEGGDVTCKSDTPATEQTEQVVAAVDDAPVNQAEVATILSDMEKAEAKTKQAEKTLQVAKNARKSVEGIPASLEKKFEIEPAAGPAQTARVKKDITPVEVQAAIGGFGVQLASYRSQADAQAGIKTFQKKFGSALGGLTPDVQKANIKGKTYYRVRFMGASDKAAANSVCKALKAKGQGCLNVAS